MATLFKNPSLVDCDPSPVVSDALRRLRESGYRELCGVDCAWSDGELVLSGRVSSYYYKQLAQAFAARGGDFPLSNQLRVAPSRATGAPE